MIIRDLIGLIAEIVRESPNLPDAACTSSPHLFDPAGDHETRESVADRQRQARRICSTCPVLDDCAVWAASIPRGRIAGVLPIRTDEREPAA
ncbi:MAG: WhiB family transcriptional regulator [Corynebacteriales bacterium]|nr:WhiB family transcriptional regulator [Mycobacteriales bacterium]